MSSIRYNPWAQTIYERIYGKQKTRKKKAAVALARKIAVSSMGLLRDETDWDPLRMLAVGLSSERHQNQSNNALKTMRPKRIAINARNCLRKEAREAKESKESTTKKRPRLHAANQTRKQSKLPRRRALPRYKQKSKDRNRPCRKTPLARSKPKPKPRRAREPVAAV